MHALFDCVLTQNGRVKSKVCSAKMWRSPKLSISFPAAITLHHAAVVGFAFGGVFLLNGGGGKGEEGGREKGCKCQGNFFKL